MSTVMLHERAIKHGVYGSLYAWRSTEDSFSVCRAVNLNSMRVVYLAAFPTFFRAETPLDTAPALMLLVARICSWFNAG
jgi:hypothetical protein